ncbi:MAG: N-acyl homoserine lactonase family protein [Bacteroidales bacterium]|nr:N-acyl homoserine lactonase family protein [Bacteroidales bacterium]
MEKIKVHVLHTGTVTVDIALPFKQKTLNPIAYTGIFRSEKHQVTLPVSAYLIEHPQGLVLVDTGWGREIRDAQKTYLGAFHYKINKGVLPEGEAIDEQLLSMGIRTADLDYVVLTHLHSDHASGLKLVADAKHILTSREELEGANADKKRYIHHMWEGVNIETFDFADSELGPQHKAYDLFGDGSIVFVWVPGHTKGLVTTLVMREGKYLMLTSDCGYARRSWEQMIMPGVCINRQQLHDALLWEKQMAASPNCIDALANHDADVTPTVIEV